MFKLFLKNIKCRLPESRRRYGLPWVEIPMTLLVYIPIFRISLKKFGIWKNHHPEGYGKNILVAGTGLEPVTFGLWAQQAIS